MKVLITGNEGQLGLELTKRLTVYELIRTGRNELDITNIDAVTDIINSTKPDIIINCAAHTAVDLCETDIDNAYKINAIGPKNLAIASQQIGAKIVQISTDYVFDGEMNQHYNEFDATHPQTIYGKSKLIGEQMVATFNPKHYIIRTAWLYGEGNNFVRTMLKLAQTNKTVKVVNDQHGTPTSTVELGKMVEHLMTTDNYGLFHGTCEGECTWYDFATEIFRLAKLDVKVLPVTTEEFPRPAKRPKYSVLDNYMLKLTSDFKFSSWQEAIAQYL
jgi:dTDP-4-dehydrorhamnose reductase